MSLQKEVMDKMKEAMKAKDTLALQALRAVKSAFLLAKTATGVQAEITPDQELKIIQKQVKQRRDSAAIFITQNRQDLADPELAENQLIFPNADTLAKSHSFRSLTGPEEQRFSAAWQNLLLGS